MAGTVLKCIMHYLLKLHNISMGWVILWSLTEEETGLIDDRFGSL